MIYEVQIRFTLYVKKFAIITKNYLSLPMHADDLVQMSETIKGLMNKSIKLKEAFESKVLKVNH